VLDDLLDDVRFRGRSFRGGRAVLRRRLRGGFRRLQRRPRRRRLAPLLGTNPRRMD